MDKYSGGSGAGTIALGRQITVEFYDCSAEILADAQRMETVFLEAARVSGAHVVTSNFHSFEPQGVSGVLVISESHFAVHAWPEHDYAAVDLFTCGAGVDFDAAVRSLAAGMRSGHWIISSSMDRGIIHESGQIEKLVPVVENERIGGLRASWESRFRRVEARAMSCCIDLYGCEDTGFYSEEKWRTFADRIAGLLEDQGDAKGRWFFSPDVENIEFFRVLGRGRIVGFVEPEKRTVYLNIFANGFFEPRRAAEFAMELLRGKYYRMQPQIRQ